MLVITSPLLNLRHEMRNGRTKINQQIGKAHHRHHKRENLHIGIIIPLAQIPHLPVVLHENMYSLKNGSVLNHDIIGLGYLQQILEPLRQEISLKII